MDIRVFSKTLVVFLTVIRCQFAEEIFKFAVVGSRIDLYCETREELGVDWFFKNQTKRYNIYLDNTIPKQFVTRYSVTVSSNQTNVLSTEKVDSTYDGVYECIEGYPRRLLKSIRLVTTTPTRCHSNDNLSAVGNTSHELYCFFSVAGNNSSDDRWPREFCANGEQWHCQILSNFNDTPLYFGCSASAKLSTDYALNENSTSFRINASHQCASNSSSNTSTPTLSVILTISDGDKQLIIIVCAVVGGSILLMISAALVLTKTRNCPKRRPREIADNRNQNESNHQIGDNQHQQDAVYDLYHTINDSPVYEEVSRESLPSPYAIYNDKESMLPNTANNSPDGVGLGLYAYAEIKKEEPSIYSKCTA